MLDQGGHDPRRLVVEVYDHPQPATVIDVSAVEVLAAGACVSRSMIRVGDGAEYQLDLIHQVWPAKSQMQAGASIEHD